MSTPRLPELECPFRVGLFALAVSITAFALINGCKGGAGHYTGGGGFSTISGHSFHFRCEDRKIWHVIIYDGQPSFKGGPVPGFGGSDSFSRQLEDGKSITMEYRDNLTIRIDGKDFDLGKGAIVLVSLNGAERQYEQLPIKFERQIDTTKINEVYGYAEYVEDELRGLAKEHAKLKKFLDAQPIAPGKKK